MNDPATVLDSMDEESARAALTRCCGAHRWVEAMLAKRPFGDRESLVETARDEWSKMGPSDVLEAFSHHPRIGASLETLREKFAATERWSAQEQAAATGASEATLRALRDENLAYEARFGHIFIVCATGKSADEMLALLRERMDDDPETELWVAAAEQMKITEIRLSKLGAP